MKYKEFISSPPISCSNKKYNKQIWSNYDCLFTIKCPNASKNNISLKMISLSEIYKKDVNIIKNLAHNVDEMIRLDISI